MNGTARRLRRVGARYAGGTGEDRPLRGYAGVMSAYGDATTAGKREQCVREAAEALLYTSRIGPRGYPVAMTDYQHTATIDLPADELFAYLREPRNLPRYFPQMREAEPEAGDSLHVEADVHGEHVEGEAWLDVDEDNRKLSWGAQGPHDYHGELSIGEEDSGAARLTVTLHSVREGSDEEVQRGLEETVAALAHTAIADADGEAAEGQGS